MTTDIREAFRDAALYDIPAERAMVLCWLWRAGDVIRLTQSCGSPVRWQPAAAECGFYAGDLAGGGIQAVIGGTATDGDDVFICPSAHRQGGIPV